MAEAHQLSAGRVNASAGHLSVHVEGAHPPEVSFLFEQRPKRMTAAFLTSFGLDVAMVVLVILAGRFGLSKGLVSADEPQQALSDQIIWLTQEGPGGGGGGGGNRMKEPPRAAQLPGRDKITVPVAPIPTTPTLEPPRLAKLEPNPVEQLVIPAVPLAAGADSLPGVILAPAGPPSLSQGPGSGGGAGTGRGTGIGPGTGPGLGPGSGGGTGGGVFRLGSGVTPPVELFKGKPEYTAEAMRARIQGSVWVECVVQTSGVCSDVQVVRSLDPTFGLDDEAIKSVRKWRFRPGTRLGQPVPVLVTIEVAFTLR